jgi:hypothetical protein
MQKLGKQGNSSQGVGTDLEGIESPIICNRTICLMPHELEKKIKFLEKQLFFWKI